MNWLQNFVRPKIQSLVGQTKDVPDNLWDKCPGCSAMLFKRDLEENVNVCRHCGHHMKLGADARCKLLFDNGAYKSLPLPKVIVDPLKFRDQKKYTDRLKDAQSKTGRSDALVVASGLIGGQKAVVVVFDFAFMGGSMGMAVGEGIVMAAKHAVEQGAAFIVVPASGGARMQEGALSLMQMPRSIVAVEQVRRAGLPYIVLLTDPTMGGVTASFAMIGDLQIAEQGAMIGFAGARVIEKTIRATLPEGFQTAQYLLEHGIVDMVVNRKELAATIGRILGMLMPAESVGKGSSKAKLKAQRI